jgi:hypothetical protein
MVRAPVEAGKDIELCWRGILRAESAISRLDLKIEPCVILIRSSSRNMVVFAFLNRRSFGNLGWRVKKISWP